MDDPLCVRGDSKHQLRHRGDAVNQTGKKIGPPDAVLSGMPGILETINTNSSIAHLQG